MHKYILIKVGHIGKVEYNGAQTYISKSGVHWGSGAH